jgi:hypothetical protein
MATDRGDRGRGDAPGPIFAFVRVTGDGVLIPQEEPRAPTIEELRDLLSQLDRLPKRSGGRRYLDDKLFQQLGRFFTRQLRREWIMSMSEYPHRRIDRVRLDGKEVLLRKEVTSFDIARANMFDRGVKAVGYAKAGAWAAEQCRGMPWGDRGAETFRKADEKFQKALPKEFRRKRTHRKHHTYRKPPVR